MVLFLNLTEYAAEHNLPTSTILDVVYILLLQEKDNFPLASQLMAANTLEEAWLILDPYVASELAMIFNVPNSYNSTLDVLYELFIRSLTSLPYVSDLLNDPQFEAAFTIFNNSYSKNNNFTEAIIAVLDYAENNEVIINRTKDFIAYAWPSLFSEVILSSLSRFLEYIFKALFISLTFFVAIMLIIDVEFDNNVNKRNGFVFFVKDLILKIKGI